MGTSLYLVGSSKIQSDTGASEALDFTVAFLYDPETGHTSKHEYRVGKKDLTYNDLVALFETTTDFSDVDVVEEIERVISIEICNLKTQEEE